MSMLFNNSIIPVGSQAPTLDNGAQRPTERYSTVKTERCKTLATTQWQALPVDHTIHFVHHADSTYPKHSGIQHHHAVGGLLSRIFCLSSVRRIHCTSLHLWSNLAPFTTGYPGWQPCNPIYARNEKIKGSKTDHTRRGMSLFVGRTHNCLCPVTTILAYLAVRETSPGPLFMLKDGTTLMCQKQVKMVQSTSS